MADKRISQLIERTDIANNDVLPIVASGATTTNKVTISTIQDWMQENLDVGVTSVGLSMPSAFMVTNSPVTASGNIAVAGAGTTAQYIRGDGSLADFPSSTGGGSSVSYYLNGSVNQGTIGGVAYLEFSKEPIFGAGTDITRNSNGYIASFITDAGDPNLLLIPAGNWNFETYFSASSGGGSPTFYIELYKVSGSTSTLIASNSNAPELIAFGTNLNPYFSALAVPATTLALTDRLALRYYVTTSGRTITLHTENDHLCQIITTFTTGLTALNGLTAQVQNFATGTSGTDFNISSASTTHTFNIPSASADNRGLITTGSQTIAGAKTFSVDAVINGVNVGRGGGNLTTNTVLGRNAFISNTGGNNNTSVGDATLSSNTTGNDNTALGFTSLRLNTTGNNNTSVGSQSMFSNTSGNNNTATGSFSSYNTTTGLQNSAFGSFSLTANSTGSENTAVGFNALTNNTTANGNTGIGKSALQNNSTGFSNTSTGNLALFSNTTGSGNTAAGAASMRLNTTGLSNTSVGRAALENNTTGNFNIAVGDNAGSLVPGSGNLNTITNNSIFIGTDTRASANNQTNQIVIGHNAIGNGSNTVTIGNSSITNTYLRGTVQLTDTGTASSINIISDSTGNGAINIEKNTNGTGIRVSNAGIGQGIFANNSSTGTGILIGNTSTGKGLYIDNASGATGDPFVYSLGGAAFVKAKIDSQGNITGNSFIKSSGTSSQFLKADGSVDSSTYLTTGSAASTYVTLDTTQTISGAKTFTSALTIGTSGNSVIYEQSGSLILQTGASADLTIPSTGASTFNFGLNVTGALGVTGALNGTSAVFSGALTTSGDLFISGASKSIVFNSATNFFTQIYETSGSLVLQTGNNPRLTIASTGAATFSSSVSVGGAGFSGRIISATANNADYAVTINQQNASGGGLQIFSDASNWGARPINISSGSGTQFTITSGGNVGIGTASPTNGKLEIQQTTTAAALWVQTGGTTSASVIADFRTGSNLPALSIKGNGYVEINSTETALRLNTGAGQNALSIGGTGAISIDYPGVGGGRFSISDNGNIGMPRTHGFTTSNAANLFIDSNGLLYRSTSSIKYKININDYDKGLNIISQMRPVYYNGTGDSDSEKTFVGLIAEEVDELGLTEFVQYAEDGTPDALAYSNMVALLVKGIQELKAEIDSLKNQIK
jgi:hypothetical protein